MPGQRGCAFKTFLRDLWFCFISPLALRSMYAIVTRAHPLRYGADSNDHIKDEPPPTEDESEFPGPTSLTYMTE